MPAEMFNYKLKMDYFLNEFDILDIVAIKIHIPTEMFDLKSKKWILCKMSLIYRLLQLS